MDQINWILIKPEPIDSYLDKTTDQTSLSKNINMMDDFTRSEMIIKQYEVDYGVCFADYPAYLLEMFFSTHLTDVDAFKLAVFALKNNIPIERLIEVLQVTLTVRPSERTLNRLKEIYCSKRDSGYCYWSYDLKSGRLEYYDGEPLGMLPGAKLRRIDDVNEHHVHDRLSVFSL